MDLTVHFLVGILIFKLTGNIFAIPLSILPDLDHVIGYFYDKRKKRNIQMPKLLHIAYRPRSWLHSVFAVLILSLFFSLFIPWKVVFASLFSHILIDSLDKSGVYLLPYISKKKIRGILPVGYLEENPAYLKRHKRSHVPSMIVTAIIILILLIIFYNKK